MGRRRPIYLPVRLTRRAFIRHAAGGAAALYLGGCITPGRRVQPTERHPGALAELADREMFHRLCEAAFAETQAEYAVVRLNDARRAWAEFADNEITRLAEARSPELSVTVGCDGRIGSAQAAELSAEAVVAAVRRAEQRARQASSEPGELPPPGPQDYPVLPTWRAETATAGPRRCAAEARTIIDLCRARDLAGSGCVAADAAAVGIAASTGLCAFERRTRAEFTLTARAGSACCWAGNATRSIDELAAPEHTAPAVERLRRAGRRCAAPNGDRPVILAPPAVAALCRLLVQAAVAELPDGSPGPLSDRLETPIVDPRLTLRNRPGHPALLGNGFDADGLPSNAHVWIKNGVLKRLWYDRRAAARHGVEPTCLPDAVHLSAGDATATSLAELIGSCPRAILVTRLSDVDWVRAGGLELSATAGGGTFVVEEGSPVGTAGELKLRGDLLALLGSIEEVTEPADALADDGSKMLVPAISVPGAWWAAD